MNTLCLISANPGQKLKVLFSVEDSVVVGGPVLQSQSVQYGVYIMLIMLRTVGQCGLQSININMLVMAMMVTYSCISDHGK